MCKYNMLWVLTVMAIGVAIAVSVGRRVASYGGLVVNGLVECGLKLLVLLAKEQNIL